MSFAKRALLATTFVLFGMPACASGGGEGPQAPSETSKSRHELMNNPAPSLAGDSVNGKGKVSLDQWKGKVVLVDFWATWCEPCKKSFPKLEELRVKYGASGLEIVGISEDDEDGGAIKKFAETYGAKFPLLWDKDKALAGKYKPPNMPSSFLVDKNGVVRHVHLKYRDGDEKAIEQEVKSLL
jgi:cytochrome c biogenesis protein CcmG, thiol:disulfide interchange protein DsbE